MVQISFFRGRTIPTTDGMVPSIKMVVYEKL